MLKALNECDFHEFSIVIDLLLTCPNTARFRIAVGLSRMLKYRLCQGFML